MEWFYLVLICLGGISLAVGVARERKKLFDFLTYIFFGGGAIAILSGTAGLWMV